MLHRFKLSHNQSTIVVTLTTDGIGAVPQDDLSLAELIDGYAHGREGSARASDRSDQDRRLN
ncbi:MULTISPECIES: hypothetical protein [unclassified Sphingomonas]|nr:MULTISPECIES: hypothetical protein [unclassified Sphingomonas]KQX19176.1 hypothetical protein ASD17_11475 [Sphingomonas sp. Root1294]KQY65377.1 hypothetical protein ASD39_14670 [Sphingomonas sp. Root50]KRB95328.1 hypothetical protein ASE22_05385 [Sphingomonas sp. Root720]